MEIRISAEAVDILNASGIPVLVSPVGRIAKIPKAGWLRRSIVELISR